MSVLLFINHWVEKICYTLVMLMRVQEVCNFIRTISLTGSMQMNVQIENVFEWFRPAWGFKVPSIVDW
jgi:hypothetical protein